MALTRAEVERIAELARLKLTPEEIDRFREQLSGILDHFARLQGLDTEAIPPTFSVLESRSPLRPDQPAPGLSRDSLLSNAPEAEANQFRVPPILE